MKTDFQYTLINFYQVKTSIILNALATLPPKLSKSINFKTRQIFGKNLCIYFYHTHTQKKFSTTQTLKKRKENESDRKNCIVYKENELEA